MSEIMLEASKYYFVSVVLAALSWGFLKVTARTYNAPTERSPWKLAIPEEDLATRSGTFFPTIVISIIVGISFGLLALLMFVSATLLVLKEIGWRA